MHFLRYHLRTLRGWLIGFAVLSAIGTGLMVLVALLPESAGVQVGRTDPRSGLMFAAFICLGIGGGGFFRLLFVGLIWPGSHD